MRRVIWVGLCGAMAYSLLLLSRSVVADVMFYKGAQALAARRTMEGMEDLRLGYNVDKGLDHALVRSRFMLDLLTVAPAKFQWPMRQSILHMAGEQVSRHPNRSEAWALMANAQMASGQHSAEMQSVRHCIELDPFGTTTRVGL